MLQFMFMILIPIQHVKSTTDIERLSGQSFGILWGERMSKLSAIPRFPDSVLTGKLTQRTRLVYLDPQLPDCPKIEHMKTDQGTVPERQKQLPKFEIGSRVIGYMIFQIFALAQVTLKQLMTTARADAVHGFNA